jgi:hypothetical protein
MDYGLRKGGVQLTYSNDTVAFDNFHENYKALCQELSGDMNLRDVGKKISSFIWNYSYSILDVRDKVNIRQSLNNLRIKIDEDNYLQDAKNKHDFEEANNLYNLIYKKLYYSYYLEYLTILGNFIEKLAPTFMPNTTIQKKLLAYYDNLPFFEQFKVQNQILTKSLSEFSITEFPRMFNKLFTYYFAYNLFITTEHRGYIEKLLSLVLTKLLDDDKIRFIAKYDANYKGCYSVQQWEQFYELEDSTLEVFFLVNSVMNESFSKIGVLPKINEKIYVDKTLI